MRNHLRPFVLLTCITAATAFGGTLAMADTAPADQAGVQGEHQGKHQHHKGQRGERGHRYFKKLARELDLTDAQKTQAKALWEKSREQNKPLFEALMSARHELRTMEQSGSADEAAIRAQAAKVAVAQADLAVRRAQSVRQFQALLTPDQVTKLKAIQAKGDHKFRKSHERHEMEE